ncbi:MAG: GNAT family N-acetyltransferase [Candidatus Gracilibacteria bacterium]|nr:GNAT family N-acetyltransferase [Candidatus Gracilibacteria bacterium]
MNITIEELKDLYNRANVDWIPHIHDNSIQCCEYDDNNLVGFCQLLDDGTVVNLVVDEKYRNKGIGTKLCKQAIQNGCLFLGCLKKDVPFYNKLGFTVYYTAYSKEHKEFMYYMELESTK